MAKEIKTKTDDFRLRRILSFAIPFLLGILIWSSNFLNTNLFTFDEHNFAVWFVLSVLCFACGWFITKSIGWHLGGKIVFAVIISVTVISIIMITFLREYFAANELVTENIILYSLRNITLGAMGFFGMAVAEILIMQKDIIIIKERLMIFEDLIKDARKEAELKIKEAEISAQKIINDAESNAKDTFLRKERIEKELREFIQAEKELIRRYEEAE